MSTTRIRENKLAVSHFIKSADMVTKNVYDIAWDNLAKVSRCESVSNMMRAFYANNEDLLNEYRKSYRSIGTFGEKEDLFDLFRKVVGGIDVAYEKQLSDWDLGYMYPDFINLLNPEKKRTQLEEGMSRYLARKQGGICPICKRNMNFATQKIEIDHDRAWYKVGDRINDDNLRAVHAGCNGRKKSEYMAHTNLSDYADIA